MGFALVTSDLGHDLEPLCISFIPVVMLRRQTRLHLKTSNILICLKFYSIYLEVRMRHSEKQIYLLIRHPKWQK